MLPAAAVKGSGAKAAKGGKKKEARDDRPQGRHRGRRGERSNGAVPYAAWKEGQSAMGVLLEANASSRTRSPPCW